MQHFNFVDRNSADMHLAYIACAQHRAELADWRHRWRPMLLNGEHFPVTVVPSPFSPPDYWVLPPLDYVVSNSVKLLGTYDLVELALLRALVPVGGVVCDIGANVGAYTIPLAVHVGRNGSTIAFEPFRLVHQILVANAAVNGLANVFTHNVGLGSEPGVMSLKTPSLNSVNNIGTSRVFRQRPERAMRQEVMKYDSRKELVQVITLDSLNLSHVDLMKIDVEGALEKVLLGSEARLQLSGPERLGRLTDITNKKTMKTARFEGCFFIRK